MNRSTWAAMTDEERRIKVAELAGWKNIHRLTPEEYLERSEELTGFLDSLVGDAGDELLPVPDYLDDLNAIHEIEIELLAENNITTLHYVNNLAKVVGTDGFDVFATAAQRAQAITLTLEPE